MLNLFNLSFFLFFLIFFRLMGLHQTPDLAILFIALVMKNEAKRRPVERINHL